MKMNKFIFFIIIALIMSMPGFTSELEKEKRWADQIVDTLLDGEAVYLESEGVEFLAIEMPSKADNKIGAIVIHGIGVHPNWGQVVQPIRVSLAEAGLFTLSIQMPVLPNGSSVKDYKGLMPESALRIKSAIQYLKKQGISKIVLIAHSLGTQMASYYLSDAQGKIDKSVVGFVGVSMLETTPEYLTRIALPILDIYGSDDNQKALKSVSKRKNASLHNNNYKQVTVSGANHFFDNKEKDLLVEIKKFISSI
jgi:pimeloyl-ACP methyl ester carboxylesterase